jgi:undecaprenyl-diphosphatase
LINAMIYRQIKLRLMRPRPFVRHGHIRQGARTLDEFSFPSGHTLHAVTFGVILSVAWPPLALFWLAFAALTGLSRVVLGLHYPSDVLAATGLGLIQGALAVGIMALA